MDITAISKELNLIDAHLNTLKLMERGALLKGYLEGVAAEKENSKIEIDKLNKKLMELEAKLVRMEKQKEEVWKSETKINQKAIFQDGQ